MIALKTDSLEYYIVRTLVILCLPLPLILALWGWFEGYSTTTLLVGEGFLLLFLYWFINRFRHTVMGAFNRAALHLDAVNQEDYSQHAKPAFRQGKVAEFHQQLADLSIFLQQKKTHYDQHVYLVYQLIEQLQTPIMVFNARLKLSFANEAFYQLFEQPWQMFRHASPDLLGLDNRQANWQFKDPQRHQQWQIRQSGFIDGGETHHLLVFINIESALRESQLTAWQQIIRVLGHEIRNSLTPVSSLAESLADRADDKRDKMALNVITERCQHLQDFVSRYSSLSQKMHLSCQWLEVSALTERITGLFKNVAIDTQLSTKMIWADAVFIEQVLINLLKNAREADASSIQLTFEQSGQSSIISVSDNGHGFANLDNLFIPLYSTKQQGQGIGLSFCRNIVEQHKGTINLINNTDKGVTVTIRLPCQQQGQQQD